MSQSNSLRPVGIKEFVITDCEEKTSPPEHPVLRVALIGDVVSLAIEKYDEDAKTGTFTRVESILVDFEPLFNGLVASAASQGKKQA